MNKQSMSGARAQGGQSGFTLIELIVVIVILGILAATALPRFSNLGTDARVASLNAVRGSLSSVSAMARGQFLASATGAAVTTVNFENIAVGITNGYPTANQVTFQAAGLTAADYTYIPPGATATANSPATDANSFAVIPNSVAGKPAGLSCFVQYTQSTAVNTPPAIAVTSTTC